jgi:hypothetical protein
MKTFLILLTLFPFALSAASTVVTDFFDRPDTRRPALAVAQLRQAAPDWQFVDSLASVSLRDGRLLLHRDGGEPWQTFLIHSRTDLTAPFGISTDMRLDVVAPDRYIGLTFHFTTIDSNYLLRYSERGLIQFIKRDPENGVKVLEQVTVGAFPVQEFRRMEVISPRPGVFEWTLTRSGGSLIRGTVRDENPLTGGRVGFFSNIPERGEVHAQFDNFAVFPLSAGSPSIPALP